MEYYKVKRDKRVLIMDKYIKGIDNRDEYNSYISNMIKFMEYGRNLYFTNIKMVLFIAFFSSLFIIENFKNNENSGLCITTFTILFIGFMAHYIIRIIKCNSNITDLRKSELNNFPLSADDIKIYKFKPTNKFIERIPRHSLYSLKRNNITLEGLGYENNKIN